MQKKVNVVIVTDVPQFSNPEIQQGIRDKAEAGSWAEKRGYRTVYLLLKKVSTAERGDVLLENAVLMAIVVGFILFVGWFIGWPW